MSALTLPSGVVPQHRLLVGVFAHAAFLIPPNLVGRNGRLYLRKELDSIFCALDTATGYSCSFSQDPARYHGK